MNLVEFIICAWVKEDASLLPQKCTVTNLSKYIELSLFHSMIVYFEDYFYNYVPSKELIVQWKIIIMQWYPSLSWNYHHSSDYMSSYYPTNLYLYHIIQSWLEWKETKAHHSFNCRFWLGKHILTEVSHSAQSTMTPINFTSDQIQEYF